MNAKKITTHYSVVPLIWLLTYILGHAKWWQAALILTTIWLVAVLVAAATHWEDK